jgi:myo-inositol-1(or 4)-monophosphatase
MEEFWRFALELAHEAGKAILPNFRVPVAIENKDNSGFDPVTVADRESEARMRQMIELRFPDHGIIGEEYGNKDSRCGYTWILDPIDGTKSFVIGFPTWATLIGLTFNGKPILGLMSQPYVGETFIGSQTLGSVLLRKADTVTLRVSSTRMLSAATVGTIGPDRYKSTEQASGLRRLKSATKMVRYGGDSYFYCLVAAGCLDIALDADLQPYDILPLIPIIEGAGGVVGTWSDGDPAQGGNLLCASTQSLFEDARAALVAQTK